MHRQIIASGNLVVVTESGICYSANEVVATDTGAEIRNGKFTSHTRPKDIKQIFKLEQSLPLSDLQEVSKLASSVIQLEALIRRYEKEFGNADPMVRDQKFVIFGSATLALTILSGRTTEDIDMVASERFIDYINTRPLPEPEMAFEVVTEDILMLLGRWQDRTYEMTGITGWKFQMIHPLDTVMQKLLRMNEERWREKDIPDIEAIIENIQPTTETLFDLLTENPFRYTKSEDEGLILQEQAIEKNTRWFLERFLPDRTFGDVTRAASQRFNQKIQHAGLGKPEPFDLKAKLRLIPQHEL